MKPDFMKGRLLVNLDSEDEGQIFVSCAGGCRTLAQFDYQDEPLPEGFFAFSLSIKGLTGGHSGDDIDKKRANANKLLSPGRSTTSASSTYRPAGSTTLFPAKLGASVPFP